MVSSFKSDVFGYGGWVVIEVDIVRLCGRAYESCGPQSSVREAHVFRRWPPIDEVNL